MDMTTGPILGIIMKFALPLLLGNLFQQLYNMVDTWVIGQTGDTAAYAAVGSVAPIINVLLGFFLGFSSGAGVIISQHFGAGNKEKVEETVHTAMSLTFILGIAFTVIGVLMTPPLLKVVFGSDASEAYGPAKDYLIIYFSGIFSMCLYNMGSGILRAIGDSNRPFYFLLASAVTNTGLDLLFVFKFQMGVKGVAYATVIAQTVSAILTFIALLRSDTCVRFSFKKLAIRKETLKKILILGFPAGLQIALTAFSNVFVQSYIAGVRGNQTEILAGWTTYSKLDQFLFLPMQSLAIAVTTFVGQCLGKNDVKRAREGAFKTYLVASAINACLIAMFMIFPEPLSAFFTKDEGAIANAVLLLHNLTPFYMLCCINQVFSGALRGAGNTKAPMIIMLSSFVLARQIYLFVMANYISNELLPIAFGYPFGWLVCAVITLIYYRTYRFDPSKVMGSKGAKPAEE